MLDKILPYLVYLPYAYLALISLISIIVTVYDKAIAGYSYKVSPKDENGNSNKKGPRLRVPEGRLLLLSALGGSVAMLLTMLLIRHKTKKTKFMVGIPAIIVLQIAVVLLILFAL